jgi:hypothetical protein
VFFNLRNEEIIMKVKQKLARWLWAGAAAAAIVLAGCSEMPAWMGGGGDKPVKVTLTGAEENPPVTTSATGDGSITFGADKSLSGSVKTTGIDGIAAHIHTGARGQNGPVTIPLVKTADNVWSVKPGTTLTDEQYASYKAGNFYVNVHSPAHKGGEIRAQIQP